MSGADYYRAEARRCLQRAKGVSDPDLKRGWLSLAMEYEHLGEVAAGGSGVLPQDARGRADRQRTPESRSTQQG